MPQMRLDKLLSHLNCGSRKGSAGAHSCGTRLGGRHCAKRSGVQGRSRPVTDGGGWHRAAYRAQRYYMLNKPMGVITASRDERHDTVLELFPAELRRGLFAVGRLDKDTEGLLLITDDGALSHALMSPNRHVEKEYEAVVDGALAADAVLRFEQGMTLRDGTECKPAKLEILETEPELSVRVTLKEGKYHQVKRMIAAVGGTVTALKRLRLGGLWLDKTLAPGEFRELTQEELENLPRKPEKLKNLQIFLNFFVQKCADM